MKLLFWQHNQPTDFQSCYKRWKRHEQKTCENQNRSRKRKSNTSFFARRKSAINFAKTWKILKKNLVKEIASRTQNFFSVEKNDSDIINLSFRGRKRRKEKRDTRKKERNAKFLWGERTFFSVALSWFMVFSLNVSYLNASLSMCPIRLFMNRADSIVEAAPNTSASMTSRPASTTSTWVMYGTGKSTNIQLNECKIFWCPQKIYLRRKNGFRKIFRVVKNGRNIQTHDIYVLYTGNVLCISVIVNKLKTCLLTADRPFHWGLDSVNTKIFPLEPLLISSKEKRAFFVWSTDRVHIMSRVEWSGGGFLSYSITRQVFAWLSWRRRANNIFRKEKRAPCESHVRIKPVTTRRDTSRKTTKAENEN